jgi:hypothetical protein
MTQQPNRAELIGNNSYAAFGIAVSSGAPVLALCRELIKDGYGPSLPLEAWQGETRCHRIRSFGEAANMDVNGNSRFAFAGDSGGQPRSCVFSERPLK